MHLHRAMVAATVKGAAYRGDIFIVPSRRDQDVLVVAPLVVGRVEASPTVAAEVDLDPRMRGLRSPHQVVAPGRFCWSLLFRSRSEWHCSCYTASVSEAFRHTKIIATLGPATEGKNKLRWLISTGVDVFRLNMAHASEEWTRSIVGRIRGISQEVGRQVAVMMDVKGPEIRTAYLEEAINLERGDRIDFVTSADQSEDENGVPRVGVNYPGLAADIEIGNTMLVDSGLIQLKVLDKAETRIRCEVLTPGRLGSRRHINLPGVKVSLPSLTEKDRKDVELGASLGIDFFALPLSGKPPTSKPCALFLRGRAREREPSPRSRTSPPCTTSRASSGKPMASWWRAATSESKSTTINFRSSRSKSSMPASRRESRSSSRPTSWSP